MNVHRDLKATGWSAATAPPALPPGEVHVWRVSVKQPAERIQLLESYLSKDELQRAGRFRFAEDRRVYVVTRGYLRELLGNYLALMPRNLRFTYAANGKPALPAAAVKFNVAHAGEWALIALTTKEEIGVDLEPVDTTFAKAPLVGRFFSRHEVPGLTGLPEAEGHRAFFRAWTRKEALIKARGDGLSLPLDQFGVSFLAGDPVRVLHTDWDPEEESRWQLHSFTVASDVFGAVAWVGHQKRLRFFG